MPPLPDYPSPGVRLFPFRTRARRARLPESPGLRFSPSPFISTPNQRISERGDLRSTATRTTRASRLDQRLPFRPANLPSASCLVPGMATTAKASALQETSTARLVSQPWHVQTHVTTLRTQPLISYPHSQVKKEAGEGTARLVGGEESPRGTGPFPAPAGSFPDKKRGRVLWGRGFQSIQPLHLATHKRCVWGKAPPGFWDSWGFAAQNGPPGVSSPCREMRHSCTPGSRASWYISIYIYIYDF